MRLYLGKSFPHVRSWGSTRWRCTLLTHPLHLHNCSSLKVTFHRCLRKTQTWMHWVNFPPKRLQASLALWRVVQRGVGLCVARHRTGLLLGAVCLTQKYDFEANGITQASLERCRDENQLSSINALLEATVTCRVCGKRQILQDKVPGVEYCECREGNSVQWDRSYDGWMPFLEQHNILVWRKPHHRWPHLFAYKVYGRYDDVSLCAFTETQLNASYRTEWDPSALDLHVLGADDGLGEQQQPTSSRDTYSAQDLLYWLVKFPSFFANRDYVFRRRYRCDGPRREVVIVSEAAEEGSGVDPVTGVHRVHHYWSVMVLKAKHRDFTKPGIEYVLSYFDNPGTSLPATITNYIASTAFPNFLQRLHGASLELQRKYEAGELVYTSLPHGILGTAPTLLPTTQQQPLHTEEPVETATSRPGPIDTSTIQEVMEALGEITPSPEDNIDQLLNNALDKLDSNNVLVAKIKYYKRKVDDYRIHHKMKNETDVSDESYNRGNRYEDVLIPPVLVQQLFETMREVLKADHDMRTGKGLLHADQSNSEDGSTTAMQPCTPCSSAATRVEEVHSAPCIDTDTSDDVQDSESPPKTSWKNWFYSVFIETPISLVSPRSESIEAPSDKECEEVESQAPDASQPEAGSEKENDFTDEPFVQHVQRTPDSRVWYYVYGWMVWPTVNSESVPSVADNDNSAPRIEMKQEQTPGHSWYWSPVVATRKGGAWLYSYLTNSKL